MTDNHAEIEKLRAEVMNYRLAANQWKAAYDVVLEHRDDLLLKLAKYEGAWTKKWIDFKQVAATKALETIFKISDLSWKKQIKKKKR